MKKIAALLLMVIALFAETKFLMPDEAFIPSAETVNGSRVEATLKLGEQILKETPKFNTMLPFLKIISVVAPLLGLLGTVTGMIITFQAITLYGAGDPKLMAGGISTALVTTVLGLCVAIPTVFLHTLVQSRAKRLTQILQEEAAGMLSERAEKMGQ